LNTETLFIVLAILLAYLIGSLPSAFIVAKLRRGVDIRQVGSRNMGAMNVFYKVGFWWGMVVLALDVGKGALGVAVAKWLGADLYVQMAAGVAVIIGHNLPIFLKFKGGKGGASCIGVLAVMLPFGVPFYLAVFGLLMLITRFPTLSYSAAFLSFILVAWFYYHSVPLLVFSIILLLLPGAKYIPRIIEMRTKGGSWKHVAVRRDLKDRL
jgi:acyl phosphate:glycerol-3-phosphate acyltransferase